MGWGEEELWVPHGVQGVHGCRPGAPGDTHTHQPRPQMANGSEEMPVVPPHSRREAVTVATRGRQQVLDFQELQANAGFRGGLRSRGGGRI